MLCPPVQELQDLVLNTPILRMHLTEAIEQARWVTGRLGIPPAGRLAKAGGFPRPVAP